MIRQSNQKLGETGRLWTFSLSSVRTCPGRTPTCERACYSKAIEVRRPSVAALYAANFKASKEADFAARVIAEIHRKEPEVVRIHVAGDFYDANYCNKWLAIIRSSPRTRYWFYTKSWRIPQIREVLDRMCKLKNVKGWYSVDRDSGLPTGKTAARLAYLQVEDDDLPPDCDLVFRTQKLRKRAKKKIDGPNGKPITVCPAENGSPKKLTCDKCQLCFCATEAAVPGRIQLSLAGN